ncbi:MAG: hypothetical protein AB7D57_07585, partial [Desulfovibrionaceae bacterium]
VHISAALAAPFRGCGLGPELIRRGGRALRREGDGRAVTALIRPDNPASARSFAAAGYRPVRSDDPRVLRYVLPEEAP